MILQRNYYYKITRDDLTYFFGLYAEGDKHNLDRPMFFYCISPDRKLKDTSTTLGDTWIIDHISHDDWKFLMRVLISNRYYYEQGLGVKPMYAPISGKIVFFNNIETGETGFGAYLKEPGDKISMHAYITSDKVCFQDLSYEIGDSADIYFKQPTRIEEKTFNDVLASYGKEWNFTARRIIPAEDYRVRKGSPYFYINDRFTISDKPDTRTGTDTSRFYAGNYFGSLDEAVEILVEFNHVLQKRQANAVVNHDTESIIKEKFLTDDDGKLAKKKRGRPRKEG